MKVFLLRDVEHVGKAHTIITVSDGYAMNFLLPRNLAQIITAENEDRFKNRLVHRETAKVQVHTKSSQLADRVAALKVVIKRRLHDGDKLYGAIAAHEVVNALATQGIRVAKNQVEFPTSIKTKGSHSCVIKLSTTLRPVCALTIVAENA